MAITQVKGSYHNMPVIFHQEAGQTVQITPGRFCPACHETRYRDIDEGFLQCYQCGRAYFVPSQEQIDRASLTR
jgi:ribosomal protein L37AE/L43A